MLAVTPEQLRIFQESLAEIGRKLPVPVRARLLDLVADSLRNFKIHSGSLTTAEVAEKIIGFNQERFAEYAMILQSNGVTILQLIELFLTVSMNSKDAPGTVQIFKTGALKKSRA